eukprot:2735216-Prymnesium_polylepis.1
MCAAEVCSHNSKPFPLYRTAPNVTTRARALRTRARAPLEVTEITIGRRPARTSTTDLRPVRLVGACTVFRASTLGAGAAGEPVLATVRTRHNVQKCRILYELLTQQPTVGGTFPVSHMSYEDGAAEHILYRYRGTWGRT